MHTEPELGCSDATKTMCVCDKGEKNSIWCVMKAELSRMERGSEIIIVADNGTIQRKVSSEGKILL